MNILIPNDILTHPKASFKADDILNHKTFTNLFNKNLLHVNFLQTWNWVQPHQNSQSNGETAEEKDDLKG